MDEYIANNKYANMAMQAATANRIGGEPEFAKICERIATAQKRVDDEITILTNIADKLFGERPEMESIADRPCRSGRVGDTLDRLDSLHERLSCMTNVVSRLADIA